MILGRAAPTRSRRRPCARAWARCSRCHRLASRARQEPPTAQAADAAASTTLADAAGGATRPRLGAERAGLPDALSAAAVRIPAATDSLNVAMAATVALYEVARRWPPMPDLNELRAEGESAIAAAGTTAELEELRVRLLGRKSDLTAALRSIGELPPAERGPVGKQANEVRQALEGLLAERTAEPGGRARPPARGGPHRRDAPRRPAAPKRPSAPRLWIRRHMEDIFVGLGFTVLEGPEIEYDYYNFTALNHPPEHPARLPQDTFYLAESVLLRTHTSPMQVRAMEAQAPPIYIVVPGRVYRPDRTPRTCRCSGSSRGSPSTRTSRSPTSRACCSSSLARCSARTRARLRPGYFPFTEPSVEVDVSCFRCGGTGWEGAGRCGTCKGEAWIEILGSGMVDPNVLDYVAGTGYDKERVQGFAFGMGIERSRASSTRSPTCACSTRTTCACSSSSEPAHEGPGRLAARVLRPRPAGRGDRRRADDGGRQGRAAPPDRRGGHRRVPDRARARVRAPSQRRPAQRLRRRRRPRRAPDDRLRGAQRGRRADRGGRSPAPSCRTEPPSARPSCAASPRAA